MRRKCANLELPTKNIRISTEAYRDLSKLGTLEDTFDSVIKRLMTNNEKLTGQRGPRIPSDQNQTDTTLHPNDQSEEDDYD